MKKIWLEFLSRESQSNTWSGSKPTNWFVWQAAARSEIDYLINVIFQLFKRELSF